MTTQADERQEQDKKAGLLMTFAVLVVSVFLFLGKIAGYAKEALLANYWGRSGAVDSFKVVYNIIVFQVYAKAEKLLRPTYLPIFVKHRDQDREEEAWRFFSVTATVTLIVMTAITAGCIIWAPGIIRLGWPDMEPEHSALAANLLRIAAAAILFLVMSIVTELTLHAHKRFTLPAFAEAMRQFALPAAIGGLIGYGLYRTGAPEGITAAAYGVLVGGVLRLVLQVPALWRKLGMFRPSLDLKNPDMVRMVSLMPPVVVGLILSFARMYFDSRFSTTAGEGIYAAVDYAWRITQMPIMVLPLAVSLVVYPYVSEWATREDNERLADSLVAMTRVMAFIFVPMAVGLIVLAIPAIQFVFERGEFTYQDTLMVRRALIPYAVGIPFFAVEGSINKWYFALSDTATPNYVGASMAVLHILIAYVGVYHLRRNVGIIALAMTASKGLKVLTLYVLLRRKVGQIDSGAVALFAGKVMASTAAMVGALLVVGSALAGMLVGLETMTTMEQALMRLAYLGICGGVGAVAYLVAAAILRIEELAQVAGYVKSKLRRGK